MFVVSLSIVDYCELLTFDRGYREMFVGLSLVHCQFIGSGMMMIEATKGVRRSVFSLFFTLFLLAFPGGVSHDTTHSVAIDRDCDFRLLETTDTE